MFLKESIALHTSPDFSLTETTIDFLIEFDEVKTEMIDAEFSAFTLTEADGSEEKKSAMDRVKSAGAKVGEVLKKFAGKIVDWIKRFASVIADFFSTKWKQVKNLFKENPEDVGMTTPDAPYLAALKANANVADGEMKDVPVPGKVVRIMGDAAKAAVSKLEAESKEATSLLKKVTASAEAAKKAAKAETGDATELKKVLTNLQKQTKAAAKYAKALKKYAVSVKKGGDSEDGEKDGEKDGE